MKVTLLRRGLYSVGMEDRYLRVFRNESFTERGMRYSSYAVETEEGLVTLGCLPARYAEDWAAAVAGLAGEKGVKWSVFFGVDGDLAAYQAILSRYPEVTLVCGEKTLCDLIAGGDRIGAALPIRAARKLELGGKRLEFHVMTDNHETPSLFVLDRDNGALINADAFGADCALDVTRVSELEDKTDYFRGAELYFADIYGPKRRKVMAKSAAFVRENGVELICPAFGPAVDEDIEALLSVYERPAGRKNEKQTLAVAYAPGRGVELLAERIAAGAAEQGGVEVKTVELSAVSREDALEALRSADGVLFGLSSGGDKPVWDLLTSLKQADCSGKFAAVFHTEGADSPLPGQLRARFAMLEFNLNARDHFSTGMPAEAERKAAFDYGYGLACLLQGVPNPRQPTLVKCLICGEIFDASLGVCPVCGVGLDQCVPVEEDEAVFKKNSDRSYVLIGGGIASVAAAEAIRRRDETGSVLILSAENYLPINRPMLTKDLEEVRLNPEGLLVHPADWYRERRIELRTGVTVARLDPAAKTVVTEAGETISYDKLIYAAGAECFVPPFEGRDKPGVITLRHLWDSRELEERLKGAKRAVVIGGGVIGLEAASELLRQGVTVTVLEAAPQIIGRQADAASAAALRGIMERMGVACHEGVSIAGITGEDRADGVALEDGRHFPADFVIVACGIRANVELAKAAGIRADRAVAVNARMETNVEDIYACGDCAALDGVNYQLWQEASDQGRTAGANAAGDNVHCANTLLGLSLEGFGTSFYAIGDPGKREKVHYRTVETFDTVRNRTEKYWYEGERLAGAILIGAGSKIPEVSQAVSGHYRYEDMN